MESRDMQAVRYLPWLLGPIAIGTGLLAHLASGGALPWPPALLALAALLSMFASLLSRLRLPVWALLLLCGLAQQGLHVAFLLFAGVAADQQPSPHSHVMLQPSFPDTVAPVARHDLQELMLVSHVAAALLTALVMAGAGRRFARRPAPDSQAVRESAPDRRR